MHKYSYIYINLIDGILDLFMYSNYNIGYLNYNNLLYDIMYLLYFECK